MISGNFKYGSYISNGVILLLAHLSRRLRGELIVYRSSRLLSVGPSVRVSTLSNMNISDTNGSIATKFYLKHHWGGELAALGLGPDRIRTLMSMATESSHSDIMMKMVSPLFMPPTLKKLMGHIAFGACVGACVGGCVGHNFLARLYKVQVELL